MITPVVAMPNSPCRFRHPPEFRVGTAACLNARVHVPDDLVSPAVCSVCEWFVDTKPGQSSAKAIRWPHECQSHRYDCQSHGHWAEERPRRRRNCLIILQPRAIPRCLQSLAALPIDQVYFRGFTEYQLVVPLNRFIRESDYENYLLVADDVIATPQALDVVVSLLDRHEIATGYCRLSQDSPYVNLTRGPLRLQNGKYPLMEDYDFYHGEEVRRLQDPVCVTWFGGWALTGMRRHLWLQYPFRVNPTTGMQSDFEVFRQLARPVIAHRDAYIEHIKPTLAGFLGTEFLVGKVPPRVTKRIHHA